MILQADTTLVAVCHGKRNQKQNVWTETYNFPESTVCACLRVRACVCCVCAVDRSKQHIWCPDLLPSVCTYLPACLHTDLPYYCMDAVVVV